MDNQRLFNTQFKVDGELCTLHKYLILKDFLMEIDSCNGLWSYHKNNIRVTRGYDSIFISGEFEEDYPYTVTYAIKIEKINAQTLDNILCRLEINR